MTDADKIREWLTEQEGVKWPENIQQQSLVDVCRKLLGALEFYESKKHIIFAEDANWSDPDGYDMYDVNYIEEGLLARKAIEACAKELDPNSPSNRVTAGPE